MELKNPIDYANCSISGLRYTFGNTEKDWIYEIRHIKSHETLHTVSLAEAYRIAKLLNLEFLVCAWSRGD